jgi:hypothetical protein
MVVSAIAKFREKRAVDREFLTVGTPCLGAGTYILGYSTTK